MIISFEKYLLKERLGISDEILRLSEFIFGDIKNHVEKILLSENKLGIKKIIVNYKKDIIGQFNVSKSNKNNIYLNIGENEITIDTIYHELNHVIQFLYIGKDDFLKKTFDLKSIELTNTFVNEKDSNIFNNFIKFKYFSSKYEIDSFVYQTYHFIKSNINNKHNFNIKFDEYLKKSEGYKIYLFLKNYNVNELKNIQHDKLKIILNIIEDNYTFLIKSNNSTLKTIIKAIQQIIFKKSYINNLNIKITNIDDYLKKIEKDRQKSEKYIFNKITKLYDVIYDKL